MVQRSSVADARCRAESVGTAVVVLVLVVAGVCGLGAHARTGAWALRGGAGSDQPPSSHLNFYLRNYEDTTYESGCIRCSLPWQGARSKKKLQKVGTFPTIDHFVGLFFKNQWGLYRGDLNGFYQSFVKVILKN